MYILILLVTIFSTGGYLGDKKNTTIEMQEFTSEENCENALNLIRNKNTSINKIVGYCVEK